MTQSLLIMAAVLLITGVTSIVSHPLTLLGAGAASVLFAVLGLLSPRGRLYPGFLLVAVALTVICLLSSARNLSPNSSTIHIFSCYASIAALGVMTPDFRGFCRGVCITTFVSLTVWILAQTVRAGTISSWTVNGTAGAGNLMAAQLNMTLPFMIILAGESRGVRKLVVTLFIALGIGAVVCVGSRNGIGSLGISLVMMLLFNRAKSALTISTVLASALVFSNEILQSAFVNSFLIRFRFLRYQSQAPRSLIWSICAEHISHRPWLGIGPGHSEEVLAVIDINHAHNNIVQVALESGLPAAVLMLLVFGALLTLPARALLTDKRAWILSLSVVNYVIQSLTDIPIHHSQQTLLLAICVCEARNVLAEAVWSRREDHRLPFAEHCVPQATPERRPARAGVRAA